MATTVQRSAVPRLARLVLALLLSALAAEAAVRFVGRRVPGVRLLAEPTGTREHDPESFAEFQHAFADHLEPFREWNGFRCNSLGFHDLEFSAQLPAGGFRIVALGDSFAFGTVPYWYTEMTLLENMLVFVRQRDAHGAAPPLELDNLGVPGSGIDDYRLVYDFVGRGLEPDLVLVEIYLGNDPQDFADPSRFGREREAYPRSWLLTFLRRAGVLLRERWRAAAAPKPSPPPPSAAGNPAHVFSDDSPELARPVFSDATFADIMRNEMHTIAKAGTDPDAPDWDAFDVALDGLIDAITGDGRRVVLALAPSRLQVYPAELHALAEASRVALASLDPDLPNRHLEAFAARRGVPLIDTTAALRRASATGGRLYVPNDTHWSLRGNAIAAAEVAVDLVAQGIVPTGGAVAAAAR